MGFPDRQAIRKGTKEFASDLEDGSERIELGEYGKVHVSGPGLPSRTGIYLTNRSLLFHVEFRRHVIVRLDDVASYEGRLSHIDLQGTDGAVISINVPRAQHLDQAIRARLASLPAMTTVVPMGRHQVRFHYTPWRPKVIAGWAAEELPGEHDDVTEADVLAAKDQARRQLWTATEGGQVPPQCETRPFPAEPSQADIAASYLHWAALSREIPTAMIAAGHQVDAKGKGDPKLLIASDWELHLMLQGWPSPFSSGGNPALRVLYRQVLDYELREAPDDKHLLRLLVGPYDPGSGPRYPDRKQLFRHPGTKLLLVGLPSDPTGQAVADRVIAGIRAQSGVFGDDFSPLGRDCVTSPSAPHKRDAALQANLLPLFVGEEVERQGSIQTSTYGVVFTSQDGPWYTFPWDMFSDVERYAGGDVYRLAGDLLPFVFTASGEDGRLLVEASRQAGLTIRRSVTDPGLPDNG